MSAEQRLTFRLLSYWSRIRGAREFPALVDVSISEIMEMWHHTFTLALKPDGNSVMQYFGPELIQAIGEDVTGERLEDVVDNSMMLGNLIGFYPKVVEQRAPVSESSQFFMEGKEVRYRSLIVPFSSDGENIDYLIGTTNYKVYE